VNAYDIDLIARRVVEMLKAEGHRPDQGLIDAATLARRLGVSRGWVYENAERLGVRRLGDGAKARLRFDPDGAERAIAKGEPPLEEGGENSRPKPKKSMRADAEPPGFDGPLLPIRGKRILAPSPSTPMQRKR
jgi:hypothetical protein